VWFCCGYLWLYFHPRFFIDQGCVDIPEHKAFLDTVDLHMGSTSLTYKNLILALGLEHALLG
jgi:hypothetical protein